jgi:hypothetical protein
MSNHIRWGRVRQQVRHESRWGRRVGEVQRRPRPVGRSARAASKALLGMRPTSTAGRWICVGLTLDIVGGTVTRTWERR